MAQLIKFNTAQLNAFLDTVNAQVGASGKIRIYSGTRPANADTALSGNTVLAELALSATAFAAASARAIAINTVTNDASADATGTATFFSVLTGANVRVIDGEVGTAGADLNLNTVSIVALAVVSITSGSIAIAL